MSTTLDSPLAAQPAQHLALAPYVEQVRAWCDEHAREGNSEAYELRFGGRLLRFEPPEFALIHHSALVAGQTAEAADRLAVESVAVSLKSLEDLVRLRLSADSAPEEFHAVQAELMLDAALGSTLLTVIQARIRELEDQGLVDQALLLGKFNRRVWNTVAEVEKTIAGSEVERAAPDELMASSAEGRSWEAPSLTTILAGALLVATLIWFGLFGPLRSSGTPSRELTLADFEGQLKRVEAVPPSLFGSVNQARWDGLDTQARLNLVDQVARVLSEHGYSGALLRTEDGVPVAQWLTQRGSTLLETRELP